MLTKSELSTSTNHNGSKEFLGEARDSQRDLDTSELLSRNAINPVPSSQSAQRSNNTGQHGVQSVAAVLAVQSAPITCLRRGAEVRRPSLQQRGPERRAMHSELRRQGHLGGRHGHH